MLDLEKLTPAPWQCEPDPAAGCYCIVSPNDPEKKPLAWSRSGFEDDDANFEFTALARNAFDVMMRRKWCVEVTADGKWWIADHVHHLGYEASTVCPGRDWPDPFTALVEADKWHRECIEQPEKREAGAEPR